MLHTTSKFGNATRIIKKYENKYKYKYLTHKTYAK